MAQKKKHWDRYIVQHDVDNKLHFKFYIDSPDLHFSLTSINYSQQTNKDELKLRLNIDSTGTLSIKRRAKFK